MNELIKNANKNKKNEINNLQNYNHQTAQNFYPKDKIIFQNKETQNQDNIKLIKNNSTNFSSNFNKDKSNYSYNITNNNKYSMFNNYAYNNNKSQDKIQINNQIN